MSDDVVQDFQTSLAAKRVAARFAATQTKRANITDDNTLDQLVDMEIESMGLEGTPDYEMMQPVRDAAEDFDVEVENVLLKWIKSNMDKFDMTHRLLKRAKKPQHVVEALGSANGWRTAYLYFMEHEGHGVGTWDGDWDRLFKDHRATIKELSRHMMQKTQRDYQKLKDAMTEAAFSVEDD